MAFPNVALVAGSATGELMVHRGGTWHAEALICPQTPAQNPAQVVEVDRSGTTVFVQCAAKPAAATDPDVRDAFVYDMTTKQRRALGGTGAYGTGPMSPDGRTIVIAARGDCPMPAPVCQTKRMLLDLRSDQQTEILPSDYWLATEFRWTPIGLVYFRPLCAEAGCTSEQNAGTFVRDGSRWTKLASDRLVAADGSHLVFERRRSLTLHDGVTVVERTAGTDRLLTPNDVANEYVAGLLPDGTVVAWRPATAFEGEIVLYRGGAETRRTSGAFSSFLIGTSGDLLLAGELSGAPSWKIHAYSVSADAFATDAPAFPMTTFRVIAAP